MNKNLPRKTFADIQIVVRSRTVHRHTHTNRCNDCKASSMDEIAPLTRSRSRSSLAHGVSELANTCRKYLQKWAETAKLLIQRRVSQEVYGKMCVYFVVTHFRLSHSIGSCEKCDDKCANRSIQWQMRPGDTLRLHSILPVHRCAPIDPQVISYFAVPWPIASPGSS